MFGTLFHLAINSLTANKLRSFLATLGIVIGVGAVISMLALGAGARQEVMNKVESMGANLLVVHPARPKVRGIRSAARDILKIKDAKAILEEVPDIVAVAPQSRGAGQIKYYNENTNSTILGTTVTYFPAFCRNVAQGRIFTEHESKQMARYAILGSATKDTLFGEKEALGERIKIKGINFTVVGVLEEKGSEGGPHNPDDLVLVPLEVAMKQLNGKEHLDDIAIQVKSREALNDVVEKVTALLRRRHPPTTGGEDLFEIRNQAEMLEMATSVTSTFTILIGGIAAISLIVGGIGIMNIMLVTVTERTREIGVRKAIGARDKDILHQFLLEAVVISVFGGAMGVLLGVATAKVIGAFSNFNPLVEGQSVALALFVSSSIGIFFGYYPAQRAAKLNTIDALRYE